MLNEGLTVTYVAKTLRAARFSINRWVEWFKLYGLEGAKSLPAVWDLTPLTPLYNLLAIPSGVRLSSLSLEP